MMKLTEDRAAWDLAGMASSAGLDRPLPRKELYVPGRLQVDDEKLYWTTFDEDGEHVRGKYVQPNGNMLEQFVRLGNATPHQILCYAQRWGVLCICEHGLPASHNPRPFHVPDLDRVTWCTPLGIDNVRGGWAWEPLGRWRFFARQARAILAIAGELHQGRSSRARDWADLRRNADTIELPDTDARIDTNLANQRLILSLVINEWLEFGWVRPTFEWNENEKVAVTFGDGLFGYLAVQLMSAVGRSEGVALCSACGAPYMPSRRPRAGEQHYCRDCGRLAAMREASRRYRQRLKGKLEEA